MTNAELERRKRRTYKRMLEAEQFIIRFAGTLVGEHGYNEELGKAKGTLYGLMRECDKMGWEYPTKYVP